LSRFLKINVQMPSILTGQYVNIQQTPASVGERVLAQLIDWLIQGVYFSGMLYLYYGTIADYTSDGTLMAIIILLIVFPTFFYALLCELWFNGQTFGKQLFHMRVVKTDGSTPGLGAYIMRWMFMLIDGFTFSGLGLVVMLFNTSNRRIGDLAAGTMVIKTNSYKKMKISLDEFAPFSRNYRPAYPAAENLSLEQVGLIDQTLGLNEGDPRVHALAEQVKHTLAIETVHETDDAAFLWRVKRDYQYYALEEI